MNLLSFDTDCYGGYWRLTELVNWNHGIVTKINN